MTIFQQITQAIAGIMSISSKVDTLTAKVNAVAADVAAIKAAGVDTNTGDSSKLTQITQTLSDTQAAVLNIQAALGSSEGQ